MITQPILAASLLKPESEHTDEAILSAMKGLKKWPVMASLKMDGIRGLRVDTSCALASRTLKPIPNNSIQQRAHLLPVGFDMELWSPDLDYNTIQSIVMSEEHPQSDLIQFHVLDDFSQDTYYRARIDKILDLYQTQPLHMRGWRLNYTIYCHGPVPLFELFLKYEKENGEGICFRTDNSPYKQGRSTLKEQYLVKLCRQVYQEVTIIGFKEQMHNGNRDKYNDVGKMKRSTFSYAMEPKGIVGAFIVRNEHGLIFDVSNGVGLTNELRLSVWREQDKWLGRQIVVRSKAHGVKVKPRSPVYWGLREKGY